MKLYGYEFRYLFTLAGAAQKTDPYVLLHAKEISESGVERWIKEALLAGIRTMEDFLDFLVKEHGFIRPVIVVKAIWFEM